MKFKALESETKSIAYKGACIQASGGILHTEDKELIELLLVNPFWKAVDMPVKEINQPKTEIDEERLLLIERARALKVIGNLEKMKIKTLVKKIEEAKALLEAE